MKGRYPKILDDEIQGPAARQLFDDAKTMLRTIIDERRFAPRAVVGFWPANTAGDDITVFTDEARTTDCATFFTLRQQLTRRDGKPNVALSDFVAPIGSAKHDYLGGFVVTAGIEEVAIAQRFERANDDYNAILVKALADRFAEALAERLHKKVRKELWGYATDEDLAHRAIGEPSGDPTGAGLSRPTRSYRKGDPVPAPRRRAQHQRQPDGEHGDVAWLVGFRALPVAPGQLYFGVAKVERDQVEDYAARKSISVAEVERWLGPGSTMYPTS